MQKYFSNALVLLSGLALGLFAGEYMQKMGRGSILVRSGFAVTGICAVFVAWRLYSQFISKTYGLSADATEIADAWSLSPLFLTALMLFRTLWPVPHLGTLLIISVVSMIAWIKAGQWLSFRKGIADFGRWTYAMPLGFAVGLLSQMGWHNLNVARYLVMGQLAALIIAGAQFMLKRSMSGKNREVSS